MIRIRPIYAAALAAALLAFFINQMHFQLANGSCLFRYVLPRCDYVSYVRAAQEIVRGESPYYPDSNYIYTPLLAIVMIPFSWMSEVEGFIVWTIISTAAFAYGAFRAGSLFR
ncbi:MAG: hypothetical protein ACP5I1_19740 [Candidatus Hinthialibacter sp.]